MPRSPMVDRIPLPNSNEGRSGVVQSPVVRPGMTMLMAMISNLLSVLISIGVVVGGLGGCSRPNVAGEWKPFEIITDGIDREWPGKPLTIDDDLPLAIHVVNDDQSLGLCIEIGGETMPRQPRMDGLTVWIDPKGGKEKRFGIHVRGTAPRHPSDGIPGGADAALPADIDRRTGRKPPRPASLEPLEQVAITYSDATGPLTMAMAEVRRTGIDIGVQRNAAGALVYEFDIAFDSAPSLEALKPGATIGVGIVSGGAGVADRKPSGADGDTRQGGPPDGGGGPGGGGRMDRPGGGMMGGGPGGPPAAAKQDRSGVWLAVQLADKIETE